MKCDNLVFKILALSKKPNDIEIMNDIKNIINSMFNYSSDTPSVTLKTILVNPSEFDTMRDVNVIPDYFNTFDDFLLTGNIPKKGMTYTLEIKKSALTRVAPETLTAIIIHDILHNVMSDCARSRFMNAYNNALDTFVSKDLLYIYSNTIRSEVMFMMFLDICLRPFELTTVGYDYIGCDEVLVSLDLGEIYDKYIKSKYSSEYVPDKQPERIVVETKNDSNVVRRMMQACKNGDIRQVVLDYQRFSPLLFVKYSLDRASSGKFNIGGKDFQSCGLYDFSTNSNTDVLHNPMLENAAVSMKKQVNIRFEIDKIIVAAKYIDTEAQRAAVLYDIRCLQLKLVNMRQDIEKKILRERGDTRLLKSDLELVNSYFDELDKIRNEIANTPQRQVHYGVFVKYPAGYDF